MDHESAAAQQWARELADWRIPDDILVACPDSPWTFPTALFTEMAHAALAEDTPSRRRAEEALPPGGSVLDVGCGAGAAGLPLTSTAQLLIGVDQSPDMLQSFAEASARIGMEHRELQGRWPDIAGRTPAADVAVCHHMLYNVADLVPFVLALADHARRRVVIEMTERHPQSALNDLLAAFPWTHPA